jgi:osmoprotectant transport system substrate-binding protein
MTKKIIKLIASLSLILLITSGCGFPGLTSNSDDTIKIAAQNTSEQQIIAAIDAQMIEHYTNLKVTTINNLGSANVSFNALKKGEADMSAARYDGTDLTTILNTVGSHNAKKDSEKVKKAFNDRFDMKYFPTYGFADTYAWMVTQKTAKEKNLNTVDDLRNYAPKMTVGIDQTWLNRKGDGYSDFKKIYGFSFGKVYPMQIGLVYDSLAAGKMDAVLGYSTDGRIGSYNLKLLKDDRQFFPPYYASPVATKKILKKHPELTPVLNKLAGKISVTTMQKLNYQVDNNLKEPEVVAKTFLQQHHYFEGSGE